MCVCVYIHSVFFSCRVGGHLTYLIKVDDKAGSLFYH